MGYCLGFEDIWAGGVEERGNSMVIFGFPMYIFLRLSDSDNNQQVLVFDVAVTNLSQEIPTDSWVL